MGWFDWFTGGGSVSASASLGTNTNAPPPATLLPPPVYVPPPNEGRRIFRKFEGKRQRITVVPLNGKIRSPNGLYELNLQQDGNLVIYRLNPGQAPKSIWSTNTWGKHTIRANMQDDGNFVLYDRKNKPLWASQTNGNHNAELFLQDDGNLVLYRKGGRREPHDALWSSGTIGQPNGEAMALMQPPPPPVFAPIPLGAPQSYDGLAQMVDPNLAPTPIPIPDDVVPIYYDDWGNRREEREEERLARMQARSQERRDDRLIRHEEHDVRHDERGRVVNAQPVFINPSRPDPSGGYHHGPSGEPVPIHPIIPPAQPDPIVTPISHVMNPIVRPGMPVSPVSNTTPPTSLPTNPNGKIIRIEAPVSKVGEGAQPSGSPAKGGAAAGGTGGGDSGTHHGGGVHVAGELDGPLIGKRFGTYRSPIG